jgi:hypothetical protein
MPLMAKGHKTLVRYPDGESKVITLYTRPAEGQIIAHGWQVTKVAAGESTDNDAATEYQISVERPATESSQESSREREDREGGPESAT